MSQSRKMSLLETCLSTAIGYIVAVVAQMVIFPLFGMFPSFTSNLLIGVAFTGVSLIRGYLVRRFFNWLHLRGIN